jgi:hypothetical protein
MVKARRIKWAGNVACMQAKRNARKVLVRKPEVPVRRLPVRWEDNIKVDLQNARVGSIS